MRVAVVGHVEWVEFLAVDHVPATGEIIHSEDSHELPGGGGAAAAGQLARLAGRCDLFTALGDDDLGHRTVEHLHGLGIDVHCTFRPTSTRRAVTHVDRTGERTITVVGDRLKPSIEDPLPWELLEHMDVIYVTAGDPGAVRSSRRARILVATSRALPLLKAAAVPLDALVGSASDPSEAYEPGDLDPPPSLVVTTMGDKGGLYHVQGGSQMSYAPAALPGPIADRYGAGDSFAAALAFALARGDDAEDAVSFAARRAASVLTGRGPYEGQTAE